MFLPFTFTSETINPISLQAGYENTKKVKYVSALFFFVSLVSVFNDMLRKDNIAGLHQDYSVHSTLLLVAPVFSLVFFFFRLNSYDDYKKHFKLNFIISVFYLAYLSITLCSLSYYELLAFKKQSTYSLYIVFSNFILLINRYQRVLFNLVLLGAAGVMLAILPVEGQIKMIEFISFTLVCSIAGLLSHGLYMSWKQNLINKEKLDKTNKELEITNSYLNNSKIQLVSSNNSLQDFVYAISHDLREPIRISNNLLEIALIKGKHHFTEMEQKLLDEVKSNNKMMNIMLEDLLEYSKLGNTSLKTFTNLSKVAEKACGLLKNKIDKHQMTFHIDTLPIIECAEGEMLSLFQNLINNSIKYKNPQVIPHVEIQYVKEKKQHKIIYKDNGIGIPKNEVDNVFNIFYRAKNTKNIAGTGIGLSICKKIIENLGGQIKLESEEMHGITLTMTLPINILL